MNAFFNSEWTINGGANINTTGTNIQMEYPYLVNLTPNAFSGIYQGTNDIFLYFTYSNTGAEATFCLTLTMWFNAQASIQ
ncbi:MAG: hypothetical protein IPN13_18675 [Bacteroidetes bacterium]|nr:hypothetical protein [Bacteroidota bacterium]